MDDRILALLVHGREKPMELMKEALEALAIETFSAKTCEELERLLREVPAELVFTDTALPDGDWTDIVAAAQRSEAPASVIVVGSHQDVKLYIAAIEGGAFDFVLPPFETQALQFVVYTALDYARRRRLALSQMAHA